MHNAKKAARPSCGAAAVAWFELMEKKEISVQKKCTINTKMTGSRLPREAGGRFRFPFYTS